MRQSVSCQQAILTVLFTDQSSGTAVVFSERIIGAHKNSPNGRFDARITRQQRAIAMLQRNGAVVVQYDGPE